MKDTKRCKHCQNLRKSGITAARSGQCIIQVQEGLFNPLVGYNKPACSNFKPK